MRLVCFFHQIFQTRDRLVWILLAPLGGIAVWLLLLPISSTVQRTTLRRFQMQTTTFWQWALQQPIPAMYNAENRAQVTLEAGGAGETRFGQPRYLNHFPFRLLTFGDGRFDFLRQAQPVVFRLESSYCDRRVQTRWQARPQPGGGFTIELQEVVEE